MDDAFSTTEVCAVLQMPRTTLDAWMLRGYLDLPPGPGTGRSRRLTETEVVRFAVMYRLTIIGIPAQSAGISAEYVYLPLPRDAVLVIPGIGHTRVTTWSEIACNKSPQHDVFVVLDLATLWSFVQSRLKRLRAD